MVSMRIEKSETEWSICVWHRWKILNTYGAFGSITKTRTEIILEGTLANDPNAENAVWLEYEFKCKPGNVTRTPCAITPYHYRLE